MKNFKWK